MRTAIFHTALFLSFFTLRYITFLYVVHLSVFINWKKERLSEVGAGRAWGIITSVLRSENLVNSDDYQ
jgi:hypothetical protein